MPMTNLVKVANIKIGADRPFVLIAGSCVIESRSHSLMMAKELKCICGDLDIPLIYKSSFDKANRSSIDSFRGPGIKEGLDILYEVKTKLDCPVTSDIHEASQAELVKSVLDMIQVPAFLCRQTDLLLAASKTKLPVNIKKGQFMSPKEMQSVIKKIKLTGNNRIILTERGTSFGYNNLVVDMRSLAIMRAFGYPVVFDATHSVQEPGSLGSSSGGKREFVKVLARAAIACCIDVLFVEVHDKPEHALCDSANMISLGDLPDLLKKLKRIDEVVKTGL